MIYQFRPTKPEEFASGLDYFTEITPTPDFSWTKDKLIKEASFGNVFAAWENEFLRGFILHRLMSPEAEILATYVGIEHRGQGLMTQLLQHLMNYYVLPPRAREIVKTWFLEVHPQNTGALKAYKAANFEKVGVRPKYYQDGSEAWVMKAIIESPLK